MNGEHVLTDNRSKQIFSVKKIYTKNKNLVPVPDIIRFAEELAGVNCCCCGRCRGVGELFLACFIFERGKNYRYCLKKGYEKNESLLKG